MEFETGDDALRGTMTMTTSLTAVEGGTDVVIVHEGIPDVVPREDNETGTRMALDNLARLVEGAGRESEVPQGRHARPGGIRRPCRPGAGRGAGPRPCRCWRPCRRPTARAGTCARPAA